jgi:hypothetical protein
MSLADGVDYKLLELADDGLVDGFTTDVVAYEVAHATDSGSLTGGESAEPELLREFSDGFRTRTRSRVPRRARARAGRGRGVDVVANAGGSRSIDVDQTY